MNKVVKSYNEFVNESKARPARGNRRRLNEGSKRTIDPSDKNQLKILIDTVKNPSKGNFLGGVDYDEAVQILKKKFKYSDADIKKIVNESAEMGYGAKVGVNKDKALLMPSPGHFTTIRNFVMQNGNNTNKDKNILDKAKRKNSYLDKNDVQYLKSLGFDFDSIRNKNNSERIDYMLNESVKPADRSKLSSKVNVKEIEKDMKDNLQGMKGKQLEDWVKYMGMIKYNWNARRIDLDKKEIKEIEVVQRIIGKYAPELEYLLNWTMTKNGVLTKMTNSEIEKMLDI